MLGLFGSTRKRKKPIKVQLRAAMRRVKNLKKKAGYSTRRRKARRTYRSHRRYY